jgi:hypothetical protein
MRKWHHAKTFTKRGNRVGCRHCSPGDCRGSADTGDEYDPTSKTPAEHSDYDPSQHHGGDQS